MTFLLVALLAGPCVYAAQPADRAKLEAAGVTRVCGDADLASREALPTPGVSARPGVASPTRSPWIVANGWRFMRKPTAKYLYELPAGKGNTAEAEAFAYGADAVLKIDPADVASVGQMFAFLDRLPAADLPSVADLAVVDDGSAIVGEVMNLLARRNLLYKVVQAPSAAFRVNVAVGSAAYPRAEAADPSAFALKIRRQLTDEQRSLRVYGSEVVICRLTADATRARLHLINYGGREIEGLRLRVRGTYGDGEAHVAGAGRLPLQDLVASDGATEFSVPRLTTYAVVDVKPVR